jgi:hypothetical protein
VAKLVGLVAVVLALAMLAVAAGGVRQDPSRQPNAGFSDRVDAPIQAALEDESWGT